MSIKIEEAIDLIDKLWNLGKTKAAACSREYKQITFYLGYKEMAVAQYYIMHTGSPLSRYEKNGEIYTTLFGWEVIEVVADSHIGVLVTE